MPRHARLSAPNSLYHVTARGNRGVAIYSDDADRVFFLQRLRRYALRYSSRVYAYCLMSNHFHLLVGVDDRTISKLMQGLLQSHAQYVNRRYRCKGHLFGDRFWSEVCDQDDYLLQIIRYIHLNPVRAGLVASPELYPWSSHRVYLGLELASWMMTGRVFQLFGRHPAQAVREYALFISDAMLTVSSLRNST